MPYPVAEMGILLAYLAGIALVLLIADEPWPARLALAAFWPLSAILFATTVGLLLLALPLARPLAGTIVLLTLALLGWLGWGWS